MSSKKPSPKSSSPAPKKRDREVLTNFLSKKTHVVIKKQLLDKILKENGEEVIPGTVQEEQHGIVGTLAARVSKYEYDNTKKIIRDLHSVIFTPVEYPQLIGKSFRNFDPHKKIDDSLMIPQTYCDKTFNLPLTHQQLEKKYYNALGGNRRKTSKKHPVRKRKTNRRR
jgi:hypothetical protein